MSVFAVVQFPGSNDDRDMRFALERVLGVPSRLVWHKDAALPSDAKAVLLPGGFSYGDYLRCGAMARFSPIMADVRRFADAGGRVLGTCNGFQVLCEAGLLPGALLRNRGLHFICDDVHLRVERADTPFTQRAEPGAVLRIPIKHGEGAYFAPPPLLAALEQNRQVVLRYCGPDGAVDEASNPNGSAANIAGIVNERGNVIGLMPHPEHAVEPLIGGVDGRVILGSLVDAVRGSASA
ncbi:MAG: phosphoribosylformylglycinamidine synthase subunit PurQ [Deltaproteobacteria bacterium]|nr:MAG: phosphoribosylformylglycinamidine synthase subunit PurQ [Deltaproteobacteria bacterium]